jgi:hypothetical protein
LVQHAASPAQLTPTIKATIAAANINGMLIAIALAMRRH